MIPLTDETTHPRLKRRFPAIVVLLILANVVVFALEVVNGPDWALQYALVPDNIAHGVALWTIFTSMFIHAGLLHLGGNMLYLWVFGEELDKHYLGPVRFLIFYFLCGIAATGLQVIIDPSLDVPNLGASGAIAGVLGGFLLMFPRDRILTIIFVPIPLPAHISAVVLIGFWFLIQVGSGLLSLGSMGSGGVAYFAHIGGFIAGLLLVKLFAEPQPSPYADSRA
jgi:membrane associated rhomboid family serine protease